MQSSAELVQSSAELVQCSAELVQSSAEEEVQVLTETGIHSKKLPGLVIFKQNMSFTAMHTHTLKQIKGHFS